jgi:hypothetical protein
MKAQEPTTFIQTSIGEIAVYQQFADLTSSHKIALI